MVYNMVNKVGRPLRRRAVANAAPSALPFRSPRPQSARSLYLDAGVTTGFAWLAGPTR